LGERDRYLPGLRSWVGFKQIGVPVERAARYDDQPRVSLRGLARLARTAIFSFSDLPLTMFSWLGMISLAMFLAVSSYSVYCRLFTNLAIPGWTSQLVAMSFFAALNALGISMLGEYVVRIYDQVRSRPLYLVDRTVNISTETTDTAQSLTPRSAADQPLTPVNLDQLDPLHLDAQASHSYEHLLDQANDLLALGALMRAESEEQLDSRERPPKRAKYTDDEALVLSYRDAPSRS
jgi:hypothetical protein